MTGGGDGDPVPAQVIRSADTPRSYIVSTPSGLVRRSTRHLVAIPKREEHQEAEHQPSLDADQDVILELPASAPVPELPASAPVRDPIMTRSKTGTRINCPMRYREDK